MSAAQTESALELSAIVDRDWEFRMCNLPEFATATGDHRYDNKLDDRSLDGYRKLSEWAEKVLFELDNWDLNHSGNATQGDKCSARLLRHHCTCMYEGGKFQPYLMPLNRLEGPHIELPQLIAYMKFEVMGDYVKYLDRLKQIPTSLYQVIDLLKEGIKTKILPPAVGLESVGDQLEASVKALDGDGKKSPLWRSCPKSATSTSECEALEKQVSIVLTTVVKDAYIALKNFVVDVYVKELSNIRGKSVACLELPNGAKMYEACLKFHIGSVKSAKEVHQIGLNEVARITKEMKTACIACGMPSDGNVKEYLNKLNEDERFIAKTEKELVAYYRDVCMAIYPNLPNLFSINCMPRTPYSVIATPAAQAEQAPAAYYLGGAGDGTRAGTFYINTSVLPERPTYYAESLSLHEAIPGHHTQTMLAAENQDLPNFRRFMDDRRYSEAPGRYPIDGAFIEGWGLYSEALGADLGCYTDPHQLVGRLNMEMFRSCRLVVDTGLHAFGWTVQQAKDYMLLNTCSSETDIDAEVKRYCTWPGQATGYKMGELEIWRLRKRFEAMLPNESIRNFHDIILLQGSLPLCVIEEVLEEYIAKKTSTTPIVATTGPSKKTGPLDGAEDVSASDLSNAFSFGVGLGVGLAILIAVVSVTHPKAR